MYEGPYFRAERSETGMRIAARGRWRVGNLDGAEADFRRIARLLQKNERILLDLSGLEEIDTAGMILFLSVREKLARKGRLVVTGTTREFCRMYRLVRRFDAPAASTEKGALASVREFLADLGESALEAVRDLLLFLNFLGASTIALLRGLRHPSSLRVKETASHIYKAGVTALPIVALSSFLVGVVIAYQSAVQLEKYGANVFIVDMIGISIPRELAPLITAIIVAGRSGSSYTAQIGVMKITEELDAMKTMGFEIFRFVVLPRILAMVVALPLLIFFADIVGIYAGMLVAKAQLGINPVQFFDRLQNAVEVRHYLVGLFKAPFFAFIIAAIGCFRGFQVAGNTESVGRYTTMSVVNAIFLVVAADALFSVIFTELDI